MRTFARCGEAFLRNALFDKGGHDGFRSLLRQRVVHIVGTGVVAMSLHLEVELRMFLHQFGDTVDFNDGFRFEVGFAGFESDGVGGDFAVGSETVVERHGTLGNEHIASLLLRGLRISVQQIPPQRELT